MGNISTKVGIAALAVTAALVATNTNRIYTSLFSPSDIEKATDTKEPRAATGLTAVDEATHDNVNTFGAPKHVWVKPPKAEEAPAKKIFEVQKVASVIEARQCMALLAKQKFAYGAQNPAGDMTIRREAQTDHFRCLEEVWVIDGGVFNIGQEKILKCGVLSKDENGRTPFPANGYPDILEGAPFAVLKGVAVDRGTENISYSSSKEQATKTFFSSQDKTMAFAYAADGDIFAFHLPKNVSLGSFNRYASPLKPDAMSPETLDFMVGWQHFADKMTCPTEKSRRFRPRGAKYWDLESKLKKYFPQL